MTTDQFRVPEISCQHCVNAITKEVSAIAGVKQVVVNLADKTVKIDHEASVAATTLIKAINEAGFDEVAVLV
jgi:copper ion binding protein